MKESASSSPCAACKMQRKKCRDNCLLAPYFPQNNPQKFLLVHKVFGTGNVIKLLQDVPAEQRDEAVNSMVFEARERLRDPVNGSSATINNLQRKVAELQAQLVKTQDELSSIRTEHANLVAIVTGYNDASPDHFFFAPSPDDYHTDASYQFDTQDQLWEPLWK
ncbi:LOB domain-containing protein 11 [Cryptomeria japonica]|uniref:LOB domain-containing protein 11 n=1 Tax=Cryptomeria japonica TaxID=3369 RepID=UPI0025AD5193|nr:LOB domain-containing protein 11 [Cryptomeria japonica]